MIFFKTTLYLFIFFLISSCSFFMSQLEEQSNVVLNNKNKIALVFSHNINGETAPCGCRTFPLGGMPQVAGLLEDISKKNDQLIYIDTGDLFFSSPKIPSFIERSQKYNASSIVSLMNQLHLNYFLPGDQDFAFGPDYLSSLLKDASFQVVLSNLNTSLIPHKSFVKIDSAPHTIYLFSLIDPLLLSFDLRNQFSDPLIALSNYLSSIKDDPFTRIIVLSHMGMEKDQQLAEKFPQIDWIIGSHSQSFTNLPVLEGKTKLVQVLSRNHYLGEISITLNKDKSNDTFKLHETHQELDQRESGKNLTSSLNNFAEETKKIQLEEQEQMNKFSHTKIFKKPTYIQCMDCHREQTEHWKTTEHSLAFITLLNKKQSDNPNCISCHTLGFNSPDGFIRPKDVILFKDEDSQNKYFLEVHKAFSGIKSVRALSPSNIKTYSNMWAQLDESHKINTNFSHVQCLHCHDQGIDHPFDGVKYTLTREERLAKFRPKCLNCHTKDQAPHWYEDDNKTFLKALKKISCPLMKRE